MGVAKLLIDEGAHGIECYFQANRDTRNIIELTLLGVPRRRLRRIRGIRELYKEETNKRRFKVGLVLDYVLIKDVLDIVLDYTII